MKGGQKEVKTEDERDEGEIIDQPVDSRGQAVQRRPRLNLVGPLKFDRDFLCRPVFFLIITMIILSP
jgi:hypothetical protein